MNLNFIRYFLAVVETSSFTNAAERAHVTQPTLSAGIARLEELVGEPLFHRGRQVRLTAAGNRLLPHFRTIDHEIRQLRQRPPRDDRTALRIGFLATLPAASLAGLAASFQLHAPGTDLVLQPLARARKGASDLRNCDVALTLAEDADRAATTLWREPYLLAVPRPHKLATRDRCSVHDLADIHFVVRRHCEVSERAAASFADHGVRPPVRLRTTDDQLACRMIAAGLAAAFMPRSLIGPEIASLSIVELPWERRIVAAIGEAPKPAARDFVRFAASHDWSAGEWRIAH